eukprot:7380682-Prymnesium_polylepis.1
MIEWNPADQGAARARPNGPFTIYESPTVTTRLVKGTDLMVRNTVTGHPSRRRVFAPIASAP